MPPPGGIAGALSFSGTSVIRASVVRIIEAIEATGNVLFTEIELLSRELEARLGTRLRYCGEFHFSRESGHAVGAEQDALASEALGDQQCARCIALVDRVFELFASWTEELLAYALAHPPGAGLPLAGATPT